MQNKSTYQNLCKKEVNYGYLVVEDSGYELPLYYADFLRDISVNLGISMCAIDMHIHRKNKLRWGNKWVKIEKVCYAD